jgi:hypothetical protein
MLTKLQVTSCPQCGQPIAPTGLRLSPIKERIYEAVRRRPGITAQQLRDWVWADDLDGGPLTDTKCLHVHVAQLNTAPARDYGALAGRRISKLEGSVVSGGRSPKRKGVRIERALVNLLVGLGLPCFRVPLSGATGGEWSGDIHIPLLGRTRRVEVKCRGNGFRQLYSWLGNSDLLIVKADRRDPLAVLPLALMVELMLAAERGSKAKEQNEARPAS